MQRRDGVRSGTDMLKKLCREADRPAPFRMVRGPEQLLILDMPFDDIRQPIAAGGITRVLTFDGQRAQAIQAARALYPGRDSQPQHPPPERLSRSFD